MPLNMEKEKLPKVWLRGPVENIRSVGRAQLPSTVTGCLFHAAEHTKRHLGQLLVTVQAAKNATQ
jgi:hypothetical protein